MAGAVSAGVATRSIKIGSSPASLWCVASWTCRFRFFSAEARSQAVFHCRVVSVTEESIHKSVMASSHGGHSVAPTTPCLANANERKYDNRRVVGLRADADGLKGRRFQRMIKVQKPLAKDSAKRVVGTVNWHYTCSRFVANKQGISTSSHVRFT